MGHKASRLYLSCSRGPAKSSHLGDEYAHETKADLVVHSLHAECMSSQFIASMTATNYCHMSLHQQHNCTFFLVLD